MAEMLSRPAADRGWSGFVESLRMPAPGLRPVRVWFYRGWCWACDCCRRSSGVPQVVGYDLATSGEAADAGRRHLATECAWARRTRAALGLDPDGAR